MKTRVRTSLLALFAMAAVTPGCALEDDYTEAEMDELAPGSGMTAHPSAEASHEAAQLGAEGDAAPPSGQVVKVERTVLGDVADDRGALLACSGVSITRGAYTGAFCSGTTILDIWWGDGRRQTFVVGTTSSNNIYNIWQRWAGDPTWSGWSPVAGNGTAVNGVWLADDSPLSIEVYGTDGRYYCNTWNPGWSGWYNC